MKKAKTKYEGVQQPRNPLATAARFRQGAGVHRQSEKAARRDAKMDLRKTGGKGYYEKHWVCHNSL